MALGALHFALQRAEFPIEFTQERLAFSFRVMRLVQILELLGVVIAEPVSGNNGIQKWLFDVKEGVPNF